MGSCCRSSRGPSATRHERHKPEETILYEIVANHLETFLSETREKHDRGLPNYVEKELREYLKRVIPEPRHDERNAAGSRGRRSI